MRACVHAVFLHAAPPQAHIPPYNGIPSPASPAAPNACPCTQSGNLDIAKKCLETYFLEVRRCVALPEMLAGVLV